MLRELREPWSRVPSSRLADITLPGHAYYWPQRERDDRAAQEIPTVVEKPASRADTGQLVVWWLPDLLTFDDWWWQLWSSRENILPQQDNCPARPDNSKWKGELKISGQRTMWRGFHAVLIVWPISLWYLSSSSYPPHHQAWPGTSPVREYDILTSTRGLTPVRSRLFHNKVRLTHRPNVTSLCRQLIHPEADKYFSCHKEKFSKIFSKNKFLPCWELLSGRMCSLIQQW